MGRMNTDVGARNDDPNLLIKLDFAIKMLFGYVGEVLNLQCVVGIHLGHRCIKYGLASLSDLFVWLYAL